MRWAGILVLVAASAAGPATAAGDVVRFDCSGRSGIAAMENSYVMEPTGEGACWGHLGHHTYDIGEIREIGAVSGSIFTVEVQFSPPLELLPPDAAAVVFESSADGHAWARLHEIPYPLLLGDNEILPSRQRLDFAFDATGATARWLRIRQPRSSAEGLSGYLDSSWFDADLGAVVAPEPEPLLPEPERLVCGWDILERMIATHPCWFGGINRYDAPSFFHTYPLAEGTTVTAIRGEATFLPWRSDDYTQYGGSRREVSAHVQTSSDGVSWSDAARIEGPFGIPLAFTLQLEQDEVSYVRVVAERHPGWFAHPALKHARGFVVDSWLEVSRV